MKRIFLKKNKDRSLRHRHPWVFSGALGNGDEGIEDGEIVAVAAPDGEVLGTGYYNGRSAIAVRMLSFGDVQVTDAHLRGLIGSALQRRRLAGIPAACDAYRLIFSEGDQLPGLIADYYNGHIALQVLTLGMERLKERIVGLLCEETGAASVYERSEHEGRSTEGLTPASGALFGETPELVTIREGNLSFLVDVKRGQKTGFYLDQRENRERVLRLAAGKRVINLCSYTGGFTVAALRGGASEVISVDASADALALARENAALNGFAAGMTCEKADMFDFVRADPLQAGLIIVDPPALAKSRGALDGACRGYKDLNLQVLRRCPPGTLLLTCSCSRFIDMKLFQQILFAACHDAGRNAAIIGKYGHPADHPVSIWCPETEYLKAVLLAVE